MQQTLFPPTRTECEVRRGDCLTELPNIEPKSAKLIFADPPTCSANCRLSRKRERTSPGLPSGSDTLGA